MGVNILVVGEPGTGKSRAILNLDPEKTIIIKPNSKQLPFMGAAKKYVVNKNVFVRMDFASIGLILKDINTIADFKHITTIVLEDLTHFFSKRVMDDSKKEGYQKWSDLAVDLFKNLVDYESKLRPDLNFIIIAHTEASTDVAGAGVITLQTPGKLLDKQIKLPSYFTYVLHTYTYQEGGITKYAFLTNTDGIRIAKTPEGCFPKLIENDYLQVIDQINKYQNGELEPEKSPVQSIPTN